jgi:hypothetical protein
VCNPIQLKVLDANGGPANVSSAITMTLGIGQASDWQLSQHNDCSSGTNNLSVSFSIGMNTQTFFVKALNPSLVNSVSVSVTGIVLPGSSPGVNFSSLASAETAIGYTLRGWGGNDLPNDIMAGMCQEFFVYAIDGAGRIAGVSGGDSVSVFFDRSGVQAYSDWNCFTDMTVVDANPVFNISMNFANNQNNARFFLMIPSGSTGTLPFHEVNDSIAGSPLKSLNVVNSNVAPTRVGVSAKMQSQGCIPIKIGTQDQWNNFIPATSNTTISINNNSSGGTVSLFSAANCSGSQIPATFTLPSGIGSMVFYMSVGASTNVNISASSAGLTSNPALTFATGL